MASNKISLADWQAKLNPSGNTTTLKDDPNLVFSTATGRINNKPSDKVVGQNYEDGAVRIRRETKGRGGKAVLTISGIAKTADELERLAAKLKKKCACGGAVKDGVIEIQGDKRELVEQLLQAEGFKTKWAGG
ncbi:MULTISPECIES: stress response translation initiation inhibitor YciH [Rheinheimera]|uniref:stress response translation initiation inhibitor YciH n=1 Tax=Rheinheimera TaxID=67575 RepID=UPI001050909A|nr:stress response translation initiation inhibitor YciH [Rheinheimera sp. D18]QBL09950.1 stress response translation initiation inhibitor YciH [Rheinheimera sp. D18]